MIVLLELGTVCLGSKGTRAAMQCGVAPLFSEMDGLLAPFIKRVRKAHGASNIAREQRETSRGGKTGK